MSARTNVPSDCPHCHARDAVVVPSGWWRVALVLGWVTMVAMVLGLGLTGVAGPATVLPGVILYGLGALPFLHRRASEPATCDACGKIVEPGARRGADSSAQRSLVAVPQREGATPSLRVPPAIVSAFYGAALVGLSAVVLVGLVIGPLSGHAFSVGELVFVTVLGAMFGVVAGGVAGASESQPEERVAEPEVDAAVPLRQSA